MQRYIGMDVHAASCTLAVISEKGRKLKDFPVETNGQALVEAIRMIPGHKRCLTGDTDDRTPVLHGLVRLLLECLEVR